MDQHGPLDAFGQRGQDHELKRIAQAAEQLVDLQKNNVAEVLARIEAKLVLIDSRLESIESSMVSIEAKIDDLHLDPKIIDDAVAALKHNNDETEAAMKPPTT